MQRLNETDLQRPPSEVFNILCKLGKGSYGSVYKAQHKQNGLIVAVKKVPVDTDLSDIVKEISIMQQCDSPYIVQYFGSYFDNHDLWICMEYCGAGSVSDMMRLRGETLAQNEIATVLKQSLHGLDYLHRLRKIHRDIKAGNILLNTEGHAKLADFGVAGQLSDTLAKRNTVIGTPYWMAPEVIQEIGYDCSADIWSLGITAIEMADGKPPYGDIHPMRALFMIPSHPPPTLKRPEKWSQEFVSFVADCLIKSPDQRPSSQRLMEHAFIKGAPPPSSMLPVIEEANAIREQKLNGNLSTRDSRVNSVSSSVDGEDDNIDGCAGGEDTSGTMIKRYTADSNMSKNQKNRNSDSSSSSITGTATSLESELGTMVINPTDEEDDDEDAGTLTTPKYRPAFMDMIEREDQNKIIKEEKDKNKELAQKKSFAPLSREFEVGQYESLGTLSEEELENRLAALENDLETELRNLEIRYQHKRQPILDAINEKIQLQPIGTS